jgi:hypothetical protein
VRTSADRLFAALILLPLLLLLLLDFGDYQRAHYCNQLACLIVSLALTRWLMTDSSESPGRFPALAHAPTFFSPPTR